MGGRDHYHHYQISTNFYNSILECCRHHIREKCDKTCEFWNLVYDENGKILRWECLYKPPEQIEEKKEE